MHLPQLLLLLPAHQQLQQQLQWRPLLLPLQQYLVVQLRDSWHLCLLMGL
jgi:hypothetical protein